MGAFLLGLMIGAPLGVVVMAAVVVGARADAMDDNQADRARKAGAL